MCQHTEIVFRLPAPWRLSIYDLKKALGLKPNADNTAIQFCGCCEAEELCATDDYICLWCRYYTEHPPNLPAKATWP